MIKPGQYHHLEVVKQVEFGFYLDGKDHGEILLPNSQVQDDIEVGQSVKVFLYFDSKDRLIATTKKAKVQAGQFANLKVIDSNKVGAFLDWGLPKDLLVPFNQQNSPMNLGAHYLVYVFQDPISELLVASSKLDRFLDKTPARYQQGDKVDIIVAQKTDIGFKAIINNQHWGVLFFSDIFRDIKIGEKYSAFIKSMRSDGKIDLSFAKPGGDKFDDFAKLVLTKLKQNDGFLPLNDKSSPELISKVLKMSKGNFKKTIGNLYKKHQIEILKDGIKLKN